MTRQDDQRKNRNIEIINSYLKVFLLKCLVRKRYSGAVHKSQDSCLLCSLCRGLPSPPTRCPPTGRCQPDFAPPRSPRAPPSVWIEWDGESCTECSAVRTKLFTLWCFSARGKQGFGNVSVRARVPRCGHICGLVERWQYYLYMLAGGMAECSMTLDDSVSEEEEEGSFDELTDVTPYLQPGVELSVLNEVRQGRAVCSHVAAFSLTSLLSRSFSSSVVNSPHCNYVYMFNTADNPATCG